MVHAIEAYTSRIRKNPISDQLARKALELLSANIRTAFTNGNDREARSRILLGSMLAGMAFANAPVLRPERQLHPRDTVQAFLSLFRPAATTKARPCRALRRRTLLCQIAARLV